MSQIHACLQAGVYLRGIHHRKRRQVHAGSAVQVPVQTVRVKRRQRRHEPRHGVQTRVQGVVGGALVCAHFALPEPSAAQPHVPIAQVVRYELLNRPVGLGGLVLVHLLRHFRHQRLQSAQNPAVNFRTIRRVHRGRGFGIKAVHVGVECKEPVGVVKGAKKLALNFRHAVRIVLQVVPGLGIGEEVPAHRVGPVEVHGRKGVHGIAQSLGHFLAVFVQDQSVGDDVFVRYGILDQGRNGVQCVKPAARLVHAFRNEIRRKRRSSVYRLLVFKGIVQLGKGHRPRIKPNVNQIRFAAHGLAGRSG